MSLDKPRYYHSGYSEREKRIIDELADGLENGERLDADEVRKRYGVGAAATAYVFEAYVEETRRALLRARGDCGKISNVVASGGLKIRGSS